MVDSDQTTRRDPIHAAAPRSPGVRVAAVIIWGAFVIFPLLESVSRPGTTVHRVLTIACATVCMAGYTTMVLSMRGAVICDGIPNTRLQVPAMAAMFVTAGLLTLVDQYSWAYLFSYCAACSTMLAVDSVAYAAIGLSALLALALPLAAGANGGAAIGSFASAAGVGLIMTLVRDLRDRNRELTRARSELARMAVSQERERFARDLHDLLGHSLSVIALKAELAGRLMPGRPGQAAVEVRDIESVARTALSEVRDAVGGYRRPTLDGELEGARVALVAAGVECEIDWEREQLDPDIESVLAWAVREGATNVIRHSAANRCVVRVMAADDSNAVEVVDDGAHVSSGARNEAVGHGLAGLRERVAALRGDVAAGPLAGGGYRLAVTLPRSGR